MTEQPQTPEDPAPATAAPDPTPAVTPPPPPPPVQPGFGPADGASAAVSANERPEIPIAAAFAGGFVLALILKRLAS